MTRRANEHNRDDATAQFAPVGADDAFLDALARGEDPTGGADPLAGLLLGLRAEVERPMPAAPDVSGALLADAPAAPASLDAARQRRGRRRAAESGGAAAPGTSRKAMNPWASGLIGAAAATALVVGSGAALYNATPGSPLWGPATAVFGDRTRAVELASTLQQIEVASQEGDTEHLNALLEQARSLVDAMNRPAGNGRGAEDASESMRNLPTVTVTVTAVPVQPDPSQPKDPEAAVTTVVVPAPESQPAPSSQAPAPASQPAQPPQEVKPAQSQQPSAPAPAPQPSAKTPASQQPEGATPQVVQPSRELTPQVQYGGPSSPAAEEGAVPRVVTGSSN